MRTSSTPQDADNTEQALAVRFLKLHPQTGSGIPRKKMRSVGAINLRFLPATGSGRRAKVHKVAAPKVSYLLKRLMDLFCAGIGLIAASPLMAAIAVLIKMDSPGPVLYPAPRAGKEGRSFICLKFRTMQQNADREKAALRSQNERRGAFFKMENDPRITRIGRFLRRYSLDEIPQLWNVLLGDMSLVGPRPHPIDDFRLYVPRDLRRLDVTPGITGLWQVTARRDPSFQRNMALDLEYIERWSLMMDVRILYKTVFAVVRGTGA